MRYAIVIEAVPGSNYSAYAPDLPGCVATGDTLEEIKAEMRQAIAMHLEDVPAENIPPPSSIVEYLEIEAA